MFTIEDSGSLNGTFLNRSRIERGDLGHGDEVRSESTASSSSRDDPTAQTSPPRLHTIGSVCRRLQADFLTSRSRRSATSRTGSCSPKRTRDGYRLFGEDDIERLRRSCAPARRIPAAARSGRSWRRPRGRAGPQRNLAAEETEIGIDELCERPDRRPRRASWPSTGCSSRRWRPDADTPPSAPGSSPPVPTCATCASSRLRRQPG